MKRNENNKDFEEDEEKYVRDCSACLFNDECKFYVVDAEDCPDYAPRNFQGPRLAS